MNEIQPPPPPPVRTSTKAMLVAAMLFCGAAAGDVFLPWHITAFFGGDQVLDGIDFTEGKVEIVVGGLGAILFFLTLVWKSPQGKGRLASSAAVLAFAAAVVPVWLIARGAYAGLKTIVEVGGGYTGWGRGLYLAAVAGFAAAVAGSIAAGRLTRGPAPAPVPRRQLRKTPGS